MKWKEALDEASHAFVNNDVTTAKSKAAIALSEALKLSGNEGTEAVAAVNRLLEVLEDKSRTNTDPITEVGRQVGAEEPITTLELGEHWFLLGGFLVSFVIFLPIGMWGYFQQQMLPMQIGMFGILVFVTIAVGGNLICRFIRDERTRKENKQ